MEVLAQPPPPPAAAPAAPRRKLLLRLDDGSLIGDSTVLLNTPEGGAVLLEPQNAARVARAGQPELDRLERLLEEFRGRYPTAYKLPKSLVRNHNPYREEVRSRAAPPEGLGPQGGSGNGGGRGGGPLGAAAAAAARPPARRRPAQRRARARALPAARRSRAAVRRRRRRRCDPAARPPPAAPPSRPARPRPQGQRALKRQKSLPNGDPLLGSPPGALPPGGAYAPAAGAGGGAYGGPLPYGSGGGGDDWARRCAGVLHAIYSDLGPKEFCYNLPAKDIFYRSVRETFPGIAAAYEAAVRHPITFRDIEQRLAGNQYDGPQAFADVRARVRAPRARGWGGLHAGAARGRAARHRCGRAGRGRATGPHRPPHVPPPRPPPPGPAPAV